MTIPRTSSARSFRSNAAMLAMGLTWVGCGSYVKYDGKDPVKSVVVASDAGSDIELVPAGTFDHGLFSAVLEKYVTATGQQTAFDYDAIDKDPIARAALANYREALFSADPSALVGQTQRLAFWLNAYNVSVIAGVLANYKGQATFKVVDSGTFFNERAYRVAGLTLSLDEIEHGIVRGVWDHPNVAGSPYDAKLRVYHSELWGTDKVDPRIHVGLNCGALSCPNLQQKAWLPASLPQDLQAALEAFLADPVKGAGGKGVSALFDWFRVDFENAEGSVSKFIEKNRKGGLTGVSSVTVFLTYDWTLNSRR